MEEINPSIVNNTDKQSRIPEAILNALDEPVFCCDEFGSGLYVNEKFLNMLNIEHRDSPNSKPNIFGQNQGDSFSNLIKYAVKYVTVTKHPETIEYRKNTGDPFQFFLIKIKPIADNGQTMALVQAIDITDQKKLEISIADKKSIMVQTQRISNICSFIFDFANNVWESSPQISEIFGIDENFPHTKESFFYIINPEWQAAFEEYFASGRKDQQRFDYEYKIYRINDEKERWVRGIGEFTFDKESNPVKLIGTFEDITERKNQEEKFIYLSYHDKLTGLYNRRFYEEELRRVDTERNLPISIIIGDVNDLKLVNETYGHEKGDQLLIQAATAISNVCRADDIVARWGGDEFVILLPHTNQEETGKIVRRIKAQYANKHVGSVNVTVSFGWCTKVNINEDIQSIFKCAEERMYNNKVMESNGIKNSNIFSIVSTLNEKKPNEREHSHRVGELCRDMGIVLGLSEIDIDILTLVGYLHDIGEISIDTEILNKPGKLSNTEMSRIKRHPEVGYRLIRSCYDKSQLAEFILAHHERWDGKGYPKGLKGEQIPKIARIIALADSYDAMTNKSLYKDTLSKEDAIKEIIRNSGTQFDPQLARIFVEKVLHRPWHVPLSTFAPK